MNVKLSTVLFFASFVLCSESSAETPQWTVQPNVCITKSPGDSCKITLQITTQNMAAGVHCIFLGDQQLICSEQGRFNQYINVSIQHNTHLELKNQHQETILSQPLSIKYQDSPTMRRRIRNPWSLF